MKHWIITLVISIIVLISLHCNAQAPIGYIGLFADESHTSWCVDGEGFYPVEMWVFCLPSLNGQICSEFSISYPSNVITSTMTENHDILSILGCFWDIPNSGDDASCCYRECQYQWHWVLHQLLYVTDQTPSYCEIAPHSDAGVYQFANCLEGYPVEPCIKYTNLYINYNNSDPECTVTSVAEASWGAIKSLYR